jgi:hypothetical protein
LIIEKEDESNAFCVSIGGSRGRAKNKKRKGVDWYLIKNAEA